MRAFGFPQASFSTFDRLDRCYRMIASGSRKVMFKLPKEGGFSTKAVDYKLFIA